jgi:hypothetical protein
LQADDGTYVYAIEEEEAEANDTDSVEKKAATKLIPSKGDIVGKLNLTILYEEIGAERVVVRNGRNSNKTKSQTRFARHHPQQLNNKEFEGNCLKQLCGGTPDPSSTNLDGDSRNGGRYLRKQNPSIDRESSVQVGSAQFHRRQSTLPTTGNVKKNKSAIFLNTAILKNSWTRLQTFTSKIRLAN